MIDFDKIDKKEFLNFKDGKGVTINQAKQEDGAKIMKITLKQGCSIGKHKHEYNCEIMYIISGKATIVTKDGVEIVNKGQASYCKKGEWHETRNNNEEDLVMFAVVVEQ